MLVDSDRPTYPVASGDRAEQTGHDSRTRGRLEPRFIVEKELGRGGMGSVECVVDTTTGKRIALKRLRVAEVPKRRAERMRQLFEQEFHVLSLLEHPRIIRVYDYGSDAEGPYYTMEVVEGQDLTALSPLPPRAICAIGRDVASSLAMLHSRGFVHRDVTTRNIRCDEAGQAKLLDFGAMCRMGVAPDVVGTPAFVPPEAAQHAALDGRADLYALGACLYHAVTGRHAYPARSMHELTDLWRSPLISPQRIAPDSPPALCDLIMEMLSHSPNGRPQSAAAVFERLVAIGDLPRREELEVRSAYLSSPKLVGRDGELQDCRKALVSSFQGSGRALRIEGAPGAGCSRLLDRVVLEAKMMGATVVRADATEANEPFGVLRRVLETLMETTLSDPLSAGTPPPLRWLCGHVIDSEPSRNELLEAFRGFIRRRFRDDKLLIAVDDLHLIDEASQAGLASLASDLHATRTLLACTSLPLVDDQSAAAQLLRKHARPVKLGPISEDCVRDLLGSVFGEAHNLDLLSATLHRHAGGNPGRTMRIAQALVKSQTIRYAAGAWVLPAIGADLEVAIPRDASVGERFLQRPSDERDLTMRLALDIHRQLPRASLARLLGWQASGRLWRAFDGLVRSGILERGASGQALLPARHAKLIADLLSTEQSRTVHHELAGHYLGTGQVAIAAHHLAQAEQWDQVEVLVNAPLAPDEPDPWLHEPTAPDTLERLIAASAARDGDAPNVLRLRCRLVNLCSASEDWVRVARYGPPALAALADRCGLSDHALLSELPPEERLRTAIERAEARHREALAQNQLDASRGLELPDALHQLASILLSLGATASLSAEPTLAARLPSIAPLAPLSPALALVERLRIALVVLMQDNATACLAEIRAIHAELNAGIDGLSERAQRTLGHFTLGFLQGIEITLARPQVLERIEQTRRRSDKRAERELFAYYTAIGDVEMATAARRRLERLEVEAGNHKHFPSCWETEYSMHSLTHNVEGLRRCEQEAERVAREMPGWAPRVELARICRAQCGATSEETLERALTLFRQLGPSSTRRYALYLVCQGFFDLGRYAEARSLMQREIEALGRRPLWHEGYNLTLAIAEAHLGLHELARQHTDDHIEVYDEAGVGGLLRGRAHEYAAQVALLAGDRERFHAHAERCALFYRNGYNPDLSRRYDALMRRAVEHDMPVSGDLAQAAQFGERTSVSQLCDMMKTELSSVYDPPGRFQRTLAMLLRRLSVQAGVLYVLTGRGLTRVAHSGAIPSALELDALAESYWSYETHLDGDITVTFDDAEGETENLSQLELEGCTWQLRLLNDETCHRACGIVAYPSKQSQQPALEREAMVAATHLLLEEQGVEAIALP